MAKFIPFFGEIYTAVESSICLLQAGAAFITGNTEKAEECLEGAGKAWEDYAESNVIANPLNQLVSSVNGDKAKVKELQGKLCNSFENVLDGTPVVGHVKGIVHYASGNVEKGHKCMEAATRTVAVVGAGALTGGVGGGLILGAGAGITTGVLYDGTATVADIAINGSENAQLHGNLAVFDADEITPNVIAQTIIGLAGDGLSGASGAKLGKNIRARMSKSAAQKNLEGAYKKARVKNPAQATKITMDTAKAAKENQANLGKNVSGCTTKVVDTSNGKSSVGHSGRLQNEMRAQQFKDLGFKSKNAARNANTYGTPSHLQKMHPDVLPVKGRTVPQNACAEHHAFDNHSRVNPGYRVRTVKTATVSHKGGYYNTIKRCENCQNYGHRMGDVITDHLPHGTPVPPETFIDSGSNAHAYAAAALGAVVAAGVAVKREKNKH